MTQLSSPRSISQRPLVDVRKLVRGCAALGCLIAFGWLPTAANASCGDYVIIGGSHASADMSDSQRGSLAPGKCSGPQCRRLPVPASMPVSPNAPVADDRTAVGTDGIKQPQNALGIGCPECSVGSAAAGHPARIDRPPR